VKRFFSLAAGPLVLAASLVAGGATPSARVPASEEGAAGAITQNLLRAHVKFLASDLLGGRSPATEGDRLSELYIAAQMQAMGLEPAAPGGGYIQRVPLIGISPKVPDTMTLAAGDRTLDLALGKDFIAFSGVQQPVAKIQDAPIVFVGYGIVAPEYGWNDYKTDVRGKVVLIMNNDPESDPKLFAGKTRLWYGRWDYKYLEAARHGAVGAIIIHTDHSAGYPWQVVQTSWSGELFELPAEEEPRIQIKMWTTDAASKQIAALGGQDLDALRAAAETRDFRPVPLGVRLSFSLENTIRKVESGNVLGKLPGSDPRLARQMVVYTAHFDHLGTKPGVEPGGDAIYNGARDNASGVAAILAITKAFTELPKPPRRTILFASVTGEEQGLLGSEYLARHPPVPPGDLAADINIDEINIWGKTRDLVMIGLGKSSLDGTIRALARTQGRVVKPDAFPDKGHFYRSDQFNFAKIGVPAAYFDSGVDFIGKPAGWGEKTISTWEKTDYHQPSDQYKDSWDLSGALEDIRLDFYLGVSVADAPQMPHWNKGDEFEAARKKALAAVGTHPGASEP
jgi:Peptidase family M28